MNTTIIKYFIGISGMSPMGFGIGGCNSFDLFKKGPGWYPSPAPRY